MVNEQSLVKIRDNGVLSSRLSSKGPLIDESYSVLRAYEMGSDIRHLRDEVVHGQILPHSSYHTRRTIWNHIYRRYFRHGNEWVVERDIISSKLRELEPIRNKIAHMRELSEAEKSKLQLYSSEILNCLSN